MPARFDTHGLRTLLCEDSRFGSRFMNAICPCVSFLLLQYDQINFLMPPIILVPGNLIPGVKWLKHEADDSPASSTEVKCF